MLSELGLKPCPFCGSEDPDLQVTTSCNTRWHFVECWWPGCGAVGPSLYYQDDAIAAWNRRTPVTPTKETDHAE